MQRPPCYGHYQGTPDRLGDFIACNGDTKEPPCLVREDCSVETNPGRAPLATYNPQLVLGVFQVEELVQQIIAERPPSIVPVVRQEAVLEARRRRLNEYVLWLLNRLELRSGIPLAWNDWHKNRKGLFAISRARSECRVFVIDPANQMRHIGAFRGIPTRSCIAIRLYENPWEHHSAGTVDVPHNVLMQFPVAATYPSEILMTQVEITLEIVGYLASLIRYYLSE